VDQPAVTGTTRSRCEAGIRFDDTGVEALGGWTVHSDDLIDFEIVPVRTSEEAAAR
jgi:hypothetical protein